MHSHVVELPELAVVVEGFVGCPGLGEYIHGLLKPPAGLLHRDVQLVELAPLETPTYAKVQATVAEQVHCSCLLGQFNWVVKGQNGDAGAQPYRLGDAGQIGQ